MTPTNIIDQLKRDEGYRQFPYLDSRGVETIGYGFNLRDTGLNQTEAGQVLLQRVLTVGTALSGALPWTDRLDPVRRAVLVNMAYNMGVTKLTAFHTFLNLVQAGDYAGAAADDLHTLWALEVGDRAKRLAEQMKTGEWQ